jgi:hypothetical protein
MTTTTNLGRFSQVVRQAYAAGVWKEFRARWKALSAAGIDPVEAGDQALREVLERKAAADGPVTITDREGKA